MAQPPAFLPGGTLPANRPLARYLPPIPEGAASRWLSDQASPGSWVLDPFGASPDTVTEIARAGYRVLVSANNPISRALIEMAANPPEESELRATLADLGAAAKGPERIETHIQKLYTTHCDGCGQTVAVDWFSWERGAAAPSTRSFRCLSCGEAGEHPVIQADIDRAREYSNSGLHRARALERIAPVNDPDRAHAEEALEVYSPRAVYVLFTLINKIDGLSLSPSRRACLKALLLHACDRGNSLWPIPSNRDRPRQLTVPPRYRENNLWLALEEGIKLWSKKGPGVKLVSWIPSERLDNDLGNNTPGIYLFEGRLKELAPSLKNLQVAAVVAPIPRPNQAFWTLSALWSGWLWGKEAATTFKSILRRRRYDWGWHTAALTSSFTALNESTPPDTPMLGLIGENEPGLTGASLLAGSHAGFELIGSAQRDHLAQITWRCGRPKTAERIKPETAQAAAVQAGLDYLRSRGEPAGYLPLYTAAIEGMVKAGSFPFEAAPSTPQGEANEPTPSANFTRVQALIKDLFSYRNGFVHLVGKESSPGKTPAPDTGQYYLREASKAHINLGAQKTVAAPKTGGVQETRGTREDSKSWQKPQLQDDLQKRGTWGILGTRAALPQRIPPLSDRVEVEVVRFLIKNPGCSLESIDAEVCRVFRGLMTPESEIVEAVIESYADPVLDGSKGWQLRDGDAPSNRRKDLETARATVVRLGSKLGYQVESKPLQTDASSPGSVPYLWQEDGEPQYCIFILASAAVSEPVYLLTQNPMPGVHPIIVIPGSRANLIVTKLGLDPLLKAQITEGWKFIKYRSLRQLVDSPLINRDNLLEMIDLDPLTYTATQIRML